MRWGRAWFPRRHTRPGRATDMAPACCRRRKFIPCCATMDFRRSASPAARLRLHHRRIDRGGSGGRLVIDARNGRIIRFMPAADGAATIITKSRACSADLSPDPLDPRRRKLNHRRLRPRRPNHLRLMGRIRPRCARHGQPRWRAARYRCRRPARSRPSPHQPRRLRSSRRPRPRRNRLRHRQPPRQRTMRWRPSPPLRSRRPRTCPRRRGWSEIYGRPGFPCRDSKNAPVFPGRFLLRQMARYSRAPAAAGIRSATLSGCETSDKWPASSSMVVAFIRLAGNRSRSGLMV